MKKTVVSVTIVFIAMAFTLNAMGENEYKLLRSHNVDASQWKNSLGAKRTVYHIEIDKILGDEEIKKILKQAVKDLAKKRAVDALAVALYFKGTSQPFANAYWAPYGDWSKAEKGKAKSIFKTSISINQQLKPKKSSNVEKFGLSLGKRKMIYREICRSQDKARRIAEKKYPWDSADIKKQVEYEDMLIKLYEKEICDRYNITDKQKNSIMGEGIDNNWPD